MFCYHRNADAGALCGEEMEQSYPGVFVRECAVFETEEMPYYLVEVERNEARLVKNGAVRHTTDQSVSGSRYQKINKILTAKASDRESLLEEYVIEQYMT